MSEWLSVCLTAGLHSVLGKRVYHAYYFVKIGGYGMGNSEGQTIPYEYLELVGYEKVIARLAT